ncbi:MAG: hypothetical protein IPQ11_16640 [Bacteroidetes bacterium]|nr:hypothetical protein [Bacteroidota bacterium]
MLGVNPVKSFVEVAAFTEINVPGPAGFVSNFITCCTYIIPIDSSGCCSYTGYN